MTVDERYRERYKAGQVGRPDFNLIEVVPRHPVPPGKALDICCGTGDNALGSADERRDGPGPPQRTAGDIVLAVESSFEILALTSSHFESNHPNPPRAWRCLMQKRRTT